MHFPRYPEYKPSGVEWLGDVPAHWQTGRLRWLARRYAGGTPSKDRVDFWANGTIPWLNSGAVNDGLIIDPSAYITEAAYEGSSARWIPKGALVMALAGQGKTKGMVAQVGFRTTCNQSMAAIVPSDGIAARFLFWWLARNYENIRNLAGGDLRDGLNLDLLGDIPCPIPSVDEQTIIAAFLDRETGKIDALVAEQEKLIALLKEKRQALISHAVTKGLNPDAPMKPSGIDWLGDVPAHWEVRPLRTLANVTRGASPRPAGSPDYFDGDFIPWVTVAEITKDQSIDLVSTTEFLTQAGMESSRLFRAGTVIYSNSGATLGVPKILCMHACANDGVVAFEDLSPNVLPKFLYQFLASLTATLREMVKQGSGQPNLNTDIVKSIRIALPSAEEQATIVNEIERLSTTSATLQLEASHAITLLSERRSALISAAVTGKIDVHALG